MPKNRHKNSKTQPKKQHRSPKPRQAPASKAQAARPETAERAEPSSARSLNPVAFAIGLLAIAVAIASSVMLSLDKFDILTLPGCGAGSGCDKAAQSALGNIPIPGTDAAWPLAFIGLAYFLAVGVAWIANRKGISLALRLVLLLGAMGSLFYITVMVSNTDYFCQYCLATHIANFVIVIIALAAGGFSASSSAALWTGTTAFIVATCMLFIADRTSTVMAMEGAERDAAESIAELIERSAEPNQGTNTQDSRVTHTGRRGFTGNYLQGAEDAPIRIVIFSDYQCVDCRRVHFEVQDLLKNRTDVSFSHKHFPFCKPCNPKITGEDLHENACWAACAAEAAGILHGPEGFWTMHDLLFERGGAFTNDEFNSMLATLGWDKNQFIELLTKNPWKDPKNPGAVYPNRELVEVVRTDAKEGADAGLFYTPMMFVNGVQIRGFRKKNVLTEAVEALASKNPPRADATQDAPPSKLEKYCGDYFSNTITTQYLRMGGDRFKAIEGPEDAPVRMQFYLSYKNGLGAKVQGMVDRIRKDHPGQVNVTYRHFPVTRACNEKILESWDEGEDTCTMAKAAEAAGMLAGIDAFLAVHRWNLQNQKSWSLDALLAQSSSMGLDRAEFEQKIQSPEVAAAIEGDLSWLMMIKKGSPAALFINGKHVDHLLKDNLPVSECIVDRILNPDN